MPVWKKLSLRGKVNVLLFVILVVVLVVGLSWQYRQQRTLLFAEAVAKARIITAEATRTREYLSRQLKEGAVELNRERYGLIPVVVANRVGRLVAEDLTYTIRHTSLRFRNPDNAPDDYETAALRRFAEDGRLDRVAEFTGLGGVPVFRYLQPAYADESCLECHGDPQRSPAFLKEIYPPDRDPAYGYRAGDVLGAVSIVIPMAQIERQVDKVFRNTLLTVCGFFAALVFCLGLLLRRTVLDPLRRLSGTIGNVRRTGRFNTPLPVTGEDEIATLVEAFNAMGDELGAKTGQLEESERRFRLLIETARDAIVAFLPSGQVFLINRAAEKLFGYSRQELLGEPFDRLLAPAGDASPGGLVGQLAGAPPAWFSALHLVEGVRRDGARVALEMVVNVVDTGERPFYTASLRERPGTAV